MATKTEQIDADAAIAFSERLLDCMNNAALALMISVGHRTKLRYVTNCRAGK